MVVNLWFCRVQLANTLYEVYFGVRSIALFARVRLVVCAIILRTVLALALAIILMGILGVRCRRVVRTSL